MSEFHRYYISKYFCPKHVGGKYTTTNLIPTKIMTFRCYCGKAALLDADVCSCVCAIMANTHFPTTELTWVRISPTY